MDKLKLLFLIALLQSIVNPTFSNGRPAAVTPIGSGCSVQQPPPNSDINCAPNSTATLDDAKALAWTYAPIAKFHPMERYHLQVGLGSIPLYPLIVHFRLAILVMIDVDLFILNTGYGSMV